MPLAGCLLAAIILTGLGYGLRRVKRLSEGRRCPECGAETLRLRSHGCSAASRLSHCFAYEKRWCPDCGWEGTTRIRALECMAPGAVSFQPPPRTRNAPDPSIRKDAMPEYPARYEPRYPGRALVYVRDENGNGWLCDKGIDRSRDLAAQGCWRSDPENLPRE